MHIEYRTIVVGIVVSVLSISIFVVNVAAKRQQLHLVYYHHELIIPVSTIFLWFVAGLPCSPCKRVRQQAGILASQPVRSSIQTNSNVYRFIKFWRHFKKYLIRPTIILYLFRLRTY